MQVIPTGVTPTASRRVSVRSLSQAEFRALGLSLVAYVTGPRTDDGEANYVIHGADGIAVAVVDDLHVAEELAEQLGLRLVTVH
jgi:hypothetical protein